MQDGLTIALTLSAIVFVLALLSEGRAYTLVYWILSRTGNVQSEAQDSSDVILVERSAKQTSAPERSRSPRGAIASNRHRIRRDRIDINASPALAHRDTREPELTAHS